MSSFTATISHHSIARAPVITIKGSLRAAKRAATMRFGDGFIDHEIIIRTPDGEIASRRAIRDRQWRDCL